MHTSYRSFDPRFNDYLSNIYYKIGEPVSSHDHQLPFVVTDSAAADLGDRSRSLLHSPARHHHHDLVCVVFGRDAAGEDGEKRCHRCAVRHLLREPAASPAACSPAAVTGTIN